MKNSYLLLVSFTFFLISEAQLYPTNKIPIIHNTDTLLYPWMGGLNQPQASSADINNDGFQDVLIFDKASRTIKVLLNDSLGGYTFTPSFSSIFPKLYGFVLFKDYNCDGLIDIFTHVNSGIRVFKQEITNGVVSFILVKPLLEFDLGGNPVNIYNLNGDVPGIKDIDNDGDMDIVVFPIFGGQLVLYKNVSQELGYGCDSLIYVEETNCWGKIAESNTNNLVNFGITCKGGGNQVNHNIPKHMGSTLLLFDPNNDGKSDVLLGDVGYRNMVYLENKGTGVNAEMDSTTVDYVFPHYTNPINVLDFPAAFEADLDGDGLLDLLVSPNSTTDLNANYNCSWFYKNTGNSTQPYIFIEDDFLVKENIDVGGHATPVFVDLNSDSLLDLIVANGYLFDEAGDSTVIVRHYENIGSDTFPIFNLVTDNFANLNTLSTGYLRPTFGDLDGDGDKDMIVGDEHGDLHYFENTALSMSPANFNLTQQNYFNLSVGPRAHPQLVDVNDDGLLDLLVGKYGSYGHIAYFWNFGTVNAPAFHIDSVNLNFGGISTNESGFTQGLSTPFLHKTDTTAILYTGTDVGHVMRFELNADSLREGNFTRIDSSFFAYKTGLQSTVFITDINHDNSLDYFVGNINGGLLHYSSTQTDSVIIDTNAITDVYSLPFKLYPNPSSTFLNIEAEEIIHEGKIVIIDILGRTIEKLKLQNTSTVKIDISTYDKGVYRIILSEAESKKSVKSFIKI